MPQTQTPNPTDHTEQSADASLMDEHTLCVVFNCQVDQQHVQQFIQQVMSNIIPGTDKLYILLNTPGGSVNLGIVLFNFLRSLPVQVITHNIGQVDSIGNVIFVAGSQRYATSNSTFLFHGIATGQFAQLSVPQMKEALSQIENDEKRMTGILRENTNIGPRTLTEYYRQGKSINPDEALAKGVINEIKDVSIGPNTRRLVIAG